MARDEKRGIVGIAVASRGTRAQFPGVPSRIWKVRYLRLVRRVHRLMRHRRIRRWKFLESLRASLLDRNLWQPCRDNVASGISIGLFFAMMPMPGQTIAAALIAVRSRANIPFTVIACFVSNPLTEPFIRLAQFRFGRWLNDVVGLPIPNWGSVSPKIKGEVIRLDVAEFIAGFLFMGIGLALISYPLVHLFSAIMPHHLPIQPPKLLRKKRGNQRRAENPE